MHMLAFIGIIIILAIAIGFTNVTLWLVGKMSPEPPAWAQCGIAALIIEVLGVFGTSPAGLFGIPFLHLIIVFVVLIAICNFRGGSAVLALFLYYLVKFLLGMTVFMFFSSMFSA